MNIMTMEEVVEDAKRRLIATNEHMPTIIACTEKGNGLLILSDLPNTHEEKVKVMMAAGNQLKKKEDAVGHILYKTYFISEAWMSSHISKDAYKKGDFTRPSEDPNRVECLVIASLDMSPNSKGEGAFLEMVRDKSGKVVDLKSNSSTKSGEIDSPLLKAFFVGFYKGEELGIENEISMEAKDLW